MNDADRNAAWALRLLLASMTANHDAITLTAADIEDRGIEDQVAAWNGVAGFLSGALAGYLIVDRGYDAAVQQVAASLAERLDSTKGGAL